MAKLAHKLIAETAKAMAFEVYEECARDNLFYRMWPRQKAYVAKNWKHFVKPARATLAAMLGMSSTSEAEKEVIFEALLLDRELPGGDVTAH